MEEDTRTSLQNDYKLLHIQRKSQDLEELKERAVAYLNSVPFHEKFVVVAFEELVRTIISRKQARKAEDFLGILKGFRTLEKYGLKLLQFPWRKEFDTVKLYSSYFKHNVETSIPLIVAVPLLKVYGYQETSHEILQLQNGSPSSTTLETAFELFLSTIELGFLFKIAKDVEVYSSKITLEDVLLSRVKTIGDVKDARMYLLKLHGISSLPKRIKLDSEVKQDEHNPSIRSRNEQSSYSKTSGHGKARDELISSTGNGVDKLSDMELYGVDAHQASNPTPTFTKHYPQNMEIESNEYVDMNHFYSCEEYVSMKELPKPTTSQLPPPPTYSQAVDPYFPANMGEWVMVPEPKKQEYDISMISGLQIGEKSNAYINSNGDALHKNSGTLDENARSMPSAFKHERMEKRGLNQPKDLMYVETAKGILGPTPVLTTTSSESSRTASYSANTSMENSRKPYSERNEDFLEGYEKHQARACSGPVISSRTSKVLYVNADKTSEKKLSSTSSRRAESLPIASSREQSSSTRNKTSGNGTLNIELNHTSRATKADSKQDEKHTAPRKDSRGSETSKDSENCSICGKEATYMCGLCGQVSCEQCKGVINGLSCGIETPPAALPAVHQLQRVKNEQQETCFYCKQPSTHKCQLCQKKSCNVCHLIKTDDCSSTMGHIFKASSSTEVPVSFTEIERELNETNVCDFCRLTATFICGDCHNRICKSCMKIYEKDLCTKTKKQHYFHLISSQTKLEFTEKPWSCGRCTFNNPPQNKICAMCATSRGVTEMEYPKSGSRKCRYCTYGNAEGARICAMCSRSIDKDTAESYI